MGTPVEGLRRALLRECKRLGPNWAPRPPATELLWGRGFRVDLRQPHPLLARLAPACLQGALVDSSTPFGHWLRAALREGDGASSASTASTASSAMAAAVESEEVLRFLQEQGSLKDCVASSEVEGLRLDAVSGHVAQSEPSKSSQHVFAYNMRFTNTGNQRLRVLARQYDFIEASGELTSQVRPEMPEAAGVVGFTPLLEPGTSFEFGSGVALKSAKGVLSGRFLVAVEPAGLEGEDARLHESMEEAELMLRLVYYKGLGTEQFYLPLPPLGFDASVSCAALAHREPE